VLTAVAQRFGVSRMGHIFGQAVQAPERITMTTPPDSALRELRIVTMQNGFLVTPRHWSWREGDCADSWVFQTAEQLAAWLVVQVWYMPHAARSPVETAGG
jgi:hypothetical protein